MPDSALTVFQSAEEQLHAGQYEAALGNYLRLVRAVPACLRPRLRVGDALLGLEAREQALAVYKATAWHAIKVGQPLSGLVAVKMAVGLDPKLTDVIEILAQLYSRDSDRVGEAADMPDRREIVAEDEAQPIGGLAGQALIDAATSEAANTEGIAEYPEKLPSIPLFSFLDEEAFVAVLANLELRRHAQGQQVIQEGQPGDSFFILAEGEVKVTRQMGGRVLELAHLHRGSVFGEMALISKAPRTATVLASGHCDLLELKRASLEDQAARLESVTRALKDFTHDRFLTNLTATSPVFKPFPRSVRTEIIKKFQDFPVDPGDELIAEGEEGQGLFLILKGAVEVTKKGEGDKPVSLAKLKEGDVFGEIALLQNSPTTATCTAITRGELLFLPKRDFQAVITHHPELQAELVKITAERLQATKEIMDPGELVLIEDDDLIML